MFELKSSDRALSKVSLIIAITHENSAILNLGMIIRVTCMHGFAL